MLIHGGSLLLSHSLQFFPHASLLCGGTIRTASFSFKRSCVPEFRNPRSVGDDDRHGERRSGWEDRIGMKEEVEDEHSWMKRVYAVIEAIPEGNSAIISASLVGVLTGICVVLFNNSVNEIRDFFWDGIPDRGASWLREAPIEETWKRTILVPVCGGVFVGMLNVLRDALDGPTQGVLVTRAKAAFAPLLKSLAACITLGTGNSLGPEGPSVEIGSAIAKGIGTLFDRRGRRKVPLIASGSAAGISSGFNAAVAGCFFGVESVLWPSPSDSSVSLTNTTSMVILSAVIASVLSEVGLGGEPAFKVPDYDFRSTSELPLYLLLGILCGLVSLALTRCTSYMLRAFDNVHKDAGLPRAVFPAMGGLFVGIIALAYPEILYWGFENVDILLESQPSVKGLSADLLLQLVAVKIIATSFCRASGLVGGYYAPSLFIGAATGMAYGKLIALMVSQSHPSVLVSFFEVASPQAYGLVGMAATLAGVCQVPLTSVLLLFELTQDYRIVLPLLGAVGFSSWITSSPIRRKDYRNSRKLDDQNDASIAHSNSAPSGCSSTGEASNVSDLCEVESSLCIGDSDFEMGLDRRIYVSHAMRTRYATVLPSTLLIEAVALMLVEKQSYAIIVNDDNMLIGLISLEDIRGFSKSAEARSRRPDELMVAEMCDLDCRRCRALATVIPDMDLYSAEIIMSKHDLNLLPVVSEHGEDSEARVVGVIDRDCIRLVRQAVATTEYLYNNLAEKHEKPLV